MVSLVQMLSLPSRDIAVRPSHGALMASGDHQPTRTGEVRMLLLSVVVCGYLVSDVVVLLFNLVTSHVIILLIYH